MASLSFLADSSDWPWFFFGGSVAKKQPEHRMVTIKNPLSWGVKYTQKAQYYFQFRTDFFSSSQVLTLSNDAKLLLCILLSQSSRCGYATFNYCLDHSCAILNVSLMVAKGLLNELVSNDIIELNKDVRATIQNRTEHNITEHNITDEFVTKPKKGKKKAEIFLTEKNIVQLVAAYPRKSPHFKTGAEILKREIKNDSDLELFKEAMQNYTNDHFRKNGNYEYIFGFNKFCEGWRVYTNESLGGPVLTKEQAEKNLADYLDSILESIPDE